ncbi:ribonuclease H-like domain-containing protein, partial [Tanacetum coccineum]
RFSSNVGIDLLTVTGGLDTTLDLNYFLGRLMDDLWANELTISNFSPSDSAPISKEDINHKFLRSLPSSWNQIALNMRNKPDIDKIDIDDLYKLSYGFEDELKRLQSYSFFAQPTTGPQLENEDFQQMDGVDLEELDLRWQVAMLTVRVKKFIQRTGRNLDFKEKRPVSLDNSKIECYNCHRKGHFARECRSGSMSRRRSYGTMAEKVFKERDELKYKIAKWEESTKNLDEILNSQMSARDKTSLGYGTQLNELSSNNETDSENSLSIFDARSSDEENTPENDRFSKNRYKVVPSPITGNFLTPRADISFAGLDENAIRNKIIES